MAKRFIMTAFAQDRIGIVADITKIIFDAGCNLEDTEMTQLENEFALMLLFSAEKKDLAEELAIECRRLEREKGITAFVRELESKTGKPLESYTTHELHAEGEDQAGIVYKISRFLAEHSCNILKLRSHRRESPASGTLIYSVHIQVQVPDKIPLDDFEQGLSDLGNDIHIDITLDEPQ